MQRSHYDAVVVGSELAGWVTAALLGRHGYRVLLLGHDTLPHEYSLGPYMLPRESFEFSPFASRVVESVLDHLALLPALRRHAVVESQAFQVLMPNQRCEWFYDDALLQNEVAREFREVQGSIGQLRTAAASINQELDEWLEAIDTIPAQTLSERRLTAKLSERLKDIEDPLAAFPTNHPFRWIVRAPSRMNDWADPATYSPIRVMRHFASATRDATRILGGQQTLIQLFKQALESHNGEAREHDRVEEILVENGAVRGVRLRASGEEIGTDSVILAMNPERALDLIADPRARQLFLHERPASKGVFYRYAMHALLEPKGRPAHLQRSACLVIDPSKIDSPFASIRSELEPISIKPAYRISVAPGPSHPSALHPSSLHPSSAGTSFAASSSGSVPSPALVAGNPELLRWTLETWVDESQRNNQSYLQDLRETLLDHARSFFPFAHHHIVAIDSPHDGRPPELHGNSGIDAGETGGPSWHRGPQTMTAHPRYESPDSLGLSAWPLRSELKNMFVVGGSQLPGLGFEGAFKSALGVFRLHVREKPRASLVGRLFFPRTGKRSLR